MQVTATLTNYSNDTLKYGIMTCDIGCFGIDNTDLFIPTCDGKDCFKNILEIFVIPPHKSRSVKVILQKRNNANDFPGTFKFSFDLLLANGDETMDSVIYGGNGHLIRIPDSELNKRRHLIWSNTIAM